MGTEPNMVRDICPICREEVFTWENYYDFEVAITHEECAWEYMRENIFKRGDDIG